MLAALLIWVLVGWSLAYWVSLVWGRAEPPVALPVGVAVVLPDAERVALALGAGVPVASAVGAEPPAAPDGLRLLGVALDPRAGTGVAVLGANAASVQVLRVGQALADGWVLQSVSASEVVLVPPAGLSGERRLSLAATKPVAGLVPAGALLGTPPRPAGGEVSGGMHSGLRGATDASSSNRLPAQ